MRIYWVPLFLALFTILLGLLQIIILISNQKEAEKRALTRQYQIPKNAQYVPTDIVVKYKPNLEIITPGIDQHNVSFTPDDIRGLPKNSISILKQASVKSLRRVFLDTKFPQERSFQQKYLNFIPNTEPLDPLANYFTLTIETDGNLEEKINILLKDPNIEVSEPNYYIFASTHTPETTPDDQFLSQQWGLQKINIGDAWDLSTGSESINVAIIDTGIDLNHQDLSARLLPGENFIEPGNSVQDDDGHGTHVAGIIGAVGNNNVGITGINWVIKLIPVRIAKKDPGNPVRSTHQAIAQGIMYAANHNSDVINISMTSPIPSSLVRDAVNTALSKDVVIVASAGNEQFYLPDYPAAFPGVIAVSSTDQNDNFSADFSNYGTGLSVAAPGVDILSTILNNQYGEKSGTSMSAPHVSGLAALILAINPSLSAQEVKNIIEKTAEKVGPYPYDGTGPNSSIQGGWNQYYGYGRINAGAALQRASGNGPCEIIDEYVYPPLTVAPGTDVPFDTVTEGECPGTITYDVYEDDGTQGPQDQISTDDEVSEFNDPADRIISDSGRTGNIWNAKSCDTADEVDDPPNRPICEYYFVATIAGSSESFVSTSSPNAGKLIRVDPNLPASSPSPNPSGSPSTSGSPRPSVKPILTYKCEEINPGIAGKQLQLKNLNCRLQTSSSPVPIPSDIPIPSGGTCTRDSGEQCSNPSACLAYLVTCENKRCVDLVNGVTGSHGPLTCDDLNYGTSGVFNWCAYPYLAPTDGTYCLEKPVIYLYPTKVTNVNVQVITSGKVVLSDPHYPEEGWQDVKAHPDGTLYYHGEKYKELFYETNVNEVRSPKTGIVVKTENLKQELTNFTYKLGLIEHEQTEFLDYWLPRLHSLQSPYILFSILDTEEKQRTDRIEITPKPDTFIEFIAYFKPLVAPISIPPLLLPDQPPKRVGFTAVEWGGVIDRNDEVH